MVTGVYLLQLRLAEIHDIRVDTNFFIRILISSPSVLRLDINSVSIQVKTKILILNFVLLLMS